MQKLSRLSICFKERIWKYVEIGLFALDTRAKN